MVGLTGASGPIGSLGLGIALGRWMPAGQGGMADLAALVMGIMVGGAFLALVVFAAGLLLVVRAEVTRPLVALGVMLVACVANVAVMMLGLVVVGRSGGPAAMTLLIVVGASVAVLVVGARLALRAGGRTSHSADTT
ncbi:unannotated protein [freshwater metagenome]|uniref:Unannotated protein n=1 Tax=freshwater metagenome TaxID=449393 RepID=A0A6J7QHI3_9ZZZZ